MRALRRWLLMAALSLPIPMLSGCDGLNPEIASRKAREAIQQRALARRTQAACGSQAAYERLKLVVFDHAIRLRNADRHNLDTLASYVAVRVEDPLVRHHDATLDLTTCRGRLVLHIPPGAERGFSGKRTLVADVAYAAQAAADGSGPVYGIKGAEPIVASLAAFDVRWRAYRTKANDDRTMLAENDLPNRDALPDGQTNTAAPLASAAALAAAGSGTASMAEPLRASSAPRVLAAKASSKSNSSPTANKSVQVAKARPAAPAARRSDQPAQLAKALPSKPKALARQKDRHLAEGASKGKVGSTKVRPSKLAKASSPKPSSRDAKPVKLAKAGSPKPSADAKAKRKQAAVATAERKDRATRSRPSKVAKASPPKPTSRKDKPAKLAKASAPKPRDLAKAKRKQAAIAAAERKDRASKSRSTKVAKASSPKPALHKAKPVKLAKASSAKSKRSASSAKPARFAKASPAAKPKPATGKKAKVQVAKASARQVARPSKPVRVADASRPVKRAAAQPKSKRVAVEAAKPSFNCRNARTRSQRMVCGDQRLASLDRRMASVYGRAITGADPSTRAELRRSRARFLDYRNNCPTAGCVAQAYQDRMDEIDDIRAGL